MSVRALLFTAALSAAVIVASVSVAQENATTPNIQDAYIVLGVTPEEAEPNIVRATVHDGKVVPDRSWEPLFFGFPTDGYVVLKVPAGEWLTINWMSLAASKGSMWSDKVFPCFRGGLLVFTAPAGKVVYAGDVMLERDADHPSIIKYHYGQFSLGDAQSYLRAHRPELADRLEMGKVQFLPFPERFCY